MSSPFPKITWPIVVPTGGYTFAWSLSGAKTATVAAGTYTSIYSVCSTLKTAMDAAMIATEDVATIAVSSIGIITITISDSWTWTHASTTAGLKTLFGLSGSESVASQVLTATSQHTHGYYPGLLSYGYAVGNGTGVSDDSDWQPEWPMAEQIAGNMTECIVGPSSPTYVRTLDFGKINQTEYRNSTIGLLGFWNNCVAGQFRLYEDRENGTVASPGTQNTDYYLCKLRKDGVSIGVDKTGEWRCTFTLRLNKEPTP